MKHNKTALLAMILALVTAATLFTGCKGSSVNVPTPPPSDEITTAPPSDVSEKVATLAIPADVNTLDPHKASGDIGRLVYMNVVESLSCFTSDYEILPLLAESLERVGDNEWIYHLKKDITFSNGEPFDAEAVIYNFERANSREYPRQAWEFREYYDHGEVIDSHTVKIITKSIDDNFENHFGEVPMLAPKHSAEIGEDALNADIIGTGPYTVESWEKNQQIVLKAREDYWGGAPEVKKYVIRTVPEAATRIAELLTGKVDIIYDLNFEDLDMLKNRNDIMIGDKRMVRVFYIAFNTCDWSPAPELEDKRVRQAINYAVDMQTIIDNILGGYGYALPTLWREDYPDGITKDENFKRYDPEKAKQLLKEAGYEDGFSIKCQTSTGLFPKAVEITQAVAGYLEKVNIKMEVVQMDFNAMRSVIINGQDNQKAEGMFMWGWATRPNTYGTLLTGITHSTGMSSYNTIPGYDEIVDKIFAEHDPAKKTQLLQEYQHMLIDDPPFMCLFQLVSIYGVSKRLNWNPNDYYTLLAKEIKFGD